MAFGEDLELLLARALARHLPGFRSLARVSQLTAGASLETYRLEVTLDSGPAALAMRRTPGGGEKLSSSHMPSLEAEAELFRVARAQGVPEPQVHAVFEPGDGLGHGFVMEWLDGETLGNRIIKADELATIRPHLARQCGEILARIHAIDLDASGLARHLQRVPTGQLIRDAMAKYDAFGISRPMLDYTGRWLIDHLPPEGELALVHNDFRNGNLIVGPDGVRAVLDWEHAFIGDPMRDIGYLCSNSWRYGNSAMPVGGFGTYEDLFAGYQSVSGKSVDRERVRYWELFASFWWALGCMELANQHRSGAARSVERLAIGRRISECEIDCVNILIPGTVGNPTSTDAGTEFADSAELIESVSEFLRGEVADLTDKRIAYLARVAANSLDIVARELCQGEAAEALELAGIKELLGHGGNLPTLRRELCMAIREGRFALDDKDLTDHLRRTTAALIAIDQPRYSGRKQVLGG